VLEVRSDRAGVVRRLGARAIGDAAVLLGAGRDRAGDHVDHGVGIVLRKKVGDPIERDEPWCGILAGEDSGKLKAARHRLLDAIEIGDHADDPLPLIVERS
jgi:pyrimidine-nucleoside phosphorylase